MNWEQSQWQLRAGHHWCPRHGPVRPRRELVPACPTCGRAAHLVVRVGNSLTTVEPAPSRCATGHLLGPRRMRVGTRPCSCAADGAHRTWTCAECADVQLWPPHDEQATAPYFGPGARSTRVD